MSQLGTRESTPSMASQTVTATEQQHQTNQEHVSVVLRLEAVSNPDERRVTWDEEVVDNENMGKKSSKSMFSQTIFTNGIVCCIFHPQREFGESSSDESSSSSSSDSDSDGERPRPRPAHNHNHPDDEPCGHSPSKRPERPKRKTRPNAYERQSRHRKAPKTPMHPTGQ
jgi:protein phosphatase 1 regulatory subunit 11